VPSPAPRRCKACGLALPEKAHYGPPRETCDDACRWAFKRGARAPEVGIVDAAALEAIARIPKPAHDRMTVADRVAHGIEQL